MDLVENSFFLPFSASRPISDVLITNIFSCPVHYFFTFLEITFDVKKFLILRRLSLSVFSSFAVQHFDVISKTPLQNSRS